MTWSVFEPCRLSRFNRDGVWRAETGGDIMKTYLVSVTTQYDGYEWLSRALVQAPTEEQAMKKANSIDFTHDNGIEVQEVEYGIEIPKNEVDILKKYFPTQIK